MYDEEFNKPLDWKHLGNLFYYNNLNKKLDHEVGSFLEKNTPFPKAYSNDLRHQYTSALYARNLGENIAKILGDWNEYTNLGMSGREDTNLDQFNNRIGREYGLKYPNMPKEELLHTLLNDADRNYSLYKFAQQQKK